MYKRRMNLLLLIVLVFQLCACQNKSADGEYRQTSVAVQIQCEEDVYGIVLEYCLDRRRLGGMSVSKNPEMDTPLPKDSPIYARFDERGFEKPEDLEEKLFGILVFVITENGAESPVEYLWEWKADYGEEYNFILSGNSEDGFRFEPVQSETEYRITPYSQLPEEIF